MLGALPGVVGTMQATEVLKYLLGAGESLAGRLLLYDALGMTFRTLNLRKDPGCPVCGDEPTITELRVDPVQESSGEAAADSDEHDEDGFPLHLDVLALRELLGGEEVPAVLDVREDWEFSMGSLPGALHIPLGQLPSRWKELPADRDLVVYCHAGVRSWEAMQFLRGVGLERVASLDGGTDAWSIHVDPSLPRY